MRKEFLSWEEREGRGVHSAVDPCGRRLFDSEGGEEGIVSSSVWPVAQWDDWEYTERGREYVRKHVFGAQAVMGGYPRQQMNKSADKDKSSDKDKDKGLVSRKSSHGNDTGGGSGSGGGRTGGGGTGTGSGVKARGGEVISRDFPSLLALLGLSHEDMLLLDHKRRGKKEDERRGKGEEKGAKEKVEEKRVGEEKKKEGKGALEEKGEGEGEEGEGVGLTGDADILQVSIAAATDDLEGKQRAISPALSLSSLLAMRDRQVNQPLVILPICQYTVSLYSLSLSLSCFSLTLT